MPSSRIITLKAPGTPLEAHQRSPRASHRSSSGAGGEDHLQRGSIRDSSGSWGRRAIGVRMADGRELRARTILSDAGAQNTFGRLLPAGLAASAGILKELKSIPPSIGHLCLYAGVRRDPGEPGFLTPPTGGFMAALITTRASHGSRPIPMRRGRACLSPSLPLKTRRSPNVIRDGRPWKWSLRFRTPRLSDGRERDGSGAGRSTTSSRGSSPPGFRPIWNAMYHRLAGESITLRFRRRSRPAISRITSTGRFMV